MLTAVSTVSIDDEFMPSWIEVFKPSHLEISGNRHLIEVLTFAQVAGFESKSWSILDVRCPLFTKASGNGDRRPRTPQQDDESSFRGGMHIDPSLDTIATDKLAL
jgi:hypothetical protein